MPSGTRNKSTALNLRCRTTLEVGVFFLKLFRIYGVIWLMHYFSSLASFISQIYCAVQRMKTILDIPRSFFFMFPLVRRWICTSRCLPRHFRQTTPCWTVCQRQLVVPWLQWPQQCASRAFSIWFQKFWTCFWVSTPHNPISVAHCLAVNFFRPVAEYPAIAPFISIYVFAHHTKNILACETDIDSS